MSHLYPWPEAERHLFVHQQVLALKELGVESRVLSPTPWAPRALWRSERQRRRGRKPREAVRDGVVAEYPRVLQPPRRLLFDRLGDLAYRSVHRLPSVRSGGYDLVHAHQALPDGALAQRLAADLGVPVVITVHGADVYQHLRMGGAVERRVRQVLGGADAVMANSSVVARLLRDVVAPEKLTVVLNGTTGLEERVAPASDYLPGEPLVLTAGQLIERKGTADLIAAVGRLRRAGRRVQLAIVGEGPLRQRSRGAGRGRGRGRRRPLRRPAGARARARDDGARAALRRAELGRGLRARLHGGHGPGHARARPPGGRPRGLHRPRRERRLAGPRA